MCRLWQREHTHATQNRGGSRQRMLIIEMWSLPFSFLCFCKRRRRRRCCCRCCYCCCCCCCYGFVVLLLDLQSGWLVLRCCSDVLRKVPLHHYTRGGGTKECCSYFLTIGWLPLIWFCCFSFCCIIVVVVVAVVVVFFFGQQQQQQTYDTKRQHPILHCYRVSVSSLSFWSFFELSSW